MANKCHPWKSENVLGCIFLHKMALQLIHHSVSLQSPVFTLNNDFGRKGRFSCLIVHVCCYWSWILQGRKRLAFSLTGPSLESWFENWGPTSVKLRELVRWDTISVTSAILISKFNCVWPPLRPRPHPKYWEKGLVTLANFLVCAESAYYRAFRDYMVASYCWWHYRVDEQILLWSNYRQILWSKSSNLASIAML